ncbi:MAG: hypothetical protein KF716_30365 [Anaerolineae bacterium]|nr:hypothetical protein [Anaerolineae bacterium]
MSTTPNEPEVEALTEAAEAASPDAVAEAMPVETSEAELPQPSPAARAVARRRIRADQRGVMTAAVLMAAGGWLGLYVMIFPLNAVPLALYRWLFFILLNIAITGTALPFLWYLNNRFSGGHPVMGGTLLREGMWCGLYCITLAWLQMIRAFNPALAFFLALIFIAIEIFLRIRERQNLPI